MQTSGLKLTRGRIEQGVDFARENAKDIILWCLEPRGFGCRIRASGACSYIFQYRLRGGRNAAVRKLTIGKSSTFGPEEARTAARKYAQAVALGRDPQMEKMAARKVLTVSALFEIWCREEGPALSPQTLVNAQSHLRIQLKPLASKRIDEITKSDVARLHASLATVPYAANRAMATLSTLFSFAVRRDWVRSDAHPVKGLRRYREKHRVRMLGATEIARLWSALITLQAEERHFFAAPAIMLGMLTGWRVGEVRTLEWENVDLTLFEATIIGKTGARTAPFPRSSQKLLQWLFEVSRNFGRGVARGRYVFPSTAGKTAERAALSDWEHHRTWAKAVKLADVDNIRRHDLRHLIAGVIGSQTGSALRVKEALGHRSLAMSERYVAPISALQRQSTDQAAALVLALAEREEGSAVPLGR
jgi:integrase